MTTMASAPEQTSLERVLDVADRLGRLRQSLSERAMSDRRAGRSVRAESRRVVRGVSTDLDQGIVPGTLGRLHECHHFDDEQITIVLLLLQRRIHEARRSLTGREILSFLHESSFDRLRGLRHLAPDGLLRNVGILEIDPMSSGGDLLDAEIRLCETVFRAIEHDVTPEIRSRKDKDTGEPRVYADHREYLLDMARLSRLYQRRAGRVFESEEPDETLSRSAVKHFEAEILNLRNLIEARLSITPGSNGYPLERLRHKHRLDDAELLILVTLLFQEIYAGTSHIEAIELVKMISGSDLELMSRRLLLARDGRLVRMGLVALTEDEGDHQVGGEAYLPAALIRLFLTGPAPTGPIDADLRLDWHEYLDGLDGSDEFFRKL
jgi:Winged helix domain, variant